VKAHAKLNLALVVGPGRSDGKHEVVTVLQRIDLCDEVTLEPAPGLAVEGFADDTIVRAALESVAAAAGVEPRWRARIDKRIPVAAGLGGGSSDAAAALQLANERLPVPLPAEQLHELAAALGADVPFFLASGPQLGTGDGSTLEPVELPADFFVCLLLPRDAVKESTAAVYARFTGAAGFGERGAALRAALATGELERLPANDLASSPLAAELKARGAFRSDVSGAGPIVYGLFAAQADAERAARELGFLGRTWISKPVVVR
jgi:4-diphosphocytidyl-2-C-methyl-D-erythritol kinase